MPIRFRWSLTRRLPRSSRDRVAIRELRSLRRVKGWSGSNLHPHYMTGSKGLIGGPTPDPRPLHNHPNHQPGQGETWGSAAARKTWRGINP